MKSWPDELEAERALQRDIKLANHQHALQKKRILLEKLFLAFLLALTAYASSILIEKYKGGITRDQFLLEARLSALMDINTYRAECSSYLINYINAADKKDFRKAEPTTFKQALEKLTLETIKLGLLFPDAFNDILARQLWLFQAMYFDPKLITAANYEFLIDFLLAVDGKILEQVHGDSSGLREAASKRPVFPIPAWTYDDLARKRGVAGYFESARESWQRWKQSNPAAPQ